MFGYSNLVPRAQFWILIGYAMLCTSCNIVPSRSQICDYGRESNTKKVFHRDLGLHIQYVCRLCCNETDSCTKMVIVYKHLSSNKGISVYELIGTITKQCLFLLLYEIFGLITLVDNATPNDLPRECKLLSHIG